MEKVWKDYVRPGLRSQLILDLHDYNDYHWGRDEVFSNLITEIVSGRYNPAASIPVTVEKRYGVARTLVIPAAEDAIVLQCVVEDLLPSALRRQPSRNAFFSRSHGFDRPEIKFEKDYIWFRRWVKFSKIRLDIATTHAFVCVTDIANYFDNIDYLHLRNMLSALDRVDEVLMDVLFRVLDSVSWRPDYLPPPGRSLPQVDFDAPRLLSHVYLYEIDEFLKARSGNSFVRWVDDITVAVDSRSEAKEVLRDLDRLLMTRGLRLNSGKTQILSPGQARAFFFVTENDYLSQETAKAEKFKSSPGRLGILTKRVRKRFDLFLKQPRRGQWDKVAKRYITIFIKLRDRHAVKYCLESLDHEPGQRDSFWRYFSALGPSRDIFRAIRGYLLGEHALDDASVFEAAKVLTTWEVTPGSALYKDIRKLGVDLSGSAYASKSPFFFISALWILAKYGVRSQIVAHLDAHEGIWSTSAFLSRQVAAVLPKFRGHPVGGKIRRKLEAHRFASANSVLVSLDNMISGVAIRPALRLYILNGQNVGVYSIQRFLTALHILGAKNFSASSRAALRDELMNYVTDPLYRKVLTKLKL